MKWIHDEDLDECESDDYGLGYRYRVRWSASYWIAEVTQVDLIRPTKILGAQFPGFEEVMNACCLDARRPPGLNCIVWEDFD